MNLLLLARRGIFGCAAFVSTAFLTGQAARAQSDVGWNFGTAAALATPSSVLPSDVAASAISSGNNLGTTTLLTTTSASSGYTGSSGQFNAGAAVRVGALNPGANGSAYFEFSLTPAADKRLLTSALRFGSRSTSTGPQAYAIFTSIDNFAAPLATGTLANNSVWALQTASFSTVTGGDGATVVYRIYGYGGTGSPSSNVANWRIDDLAVTVSTVVGSGTPPAVNGTTPVAAATQVSASTSVSVVFNQPVAVSGSWFSITGSVSGSHEAAVSGGPMNFTLTPTTPFALGESVTVTILAAQVHDQATGAIAMLADYAFTFDVIGAPPVRAIHEVQGTGTASPFTGQTVTVQGVVTASFQSTTTGIGGFFLQSPESDYDSDPATSEGIYVFDNNSPNSVPVAPGDIVTVAGTVAEFGTGSATLTELVTVTSVAKVGTASLPGPVELSLPVPSSTFLERYEGMRVRWPQSLTVNDNFDLGHFGEVTLSNGRLPQPTNVAAPGAPAQAQAAANALNQLLVDDHSSRSYPDPTPFLHDSAGQGATLRGGDTVTGLTGILSFAFGSYLLEPTESPTFASANPRTPAAPVVPGKLHVAIGNVLNLFNGNGAGGGFPTARGATSQAEYLRQQSKIVQGILGLRADIMGLTEVENDGYGDTSALQQLVSAVNAAAPTGVSYAFVDASSVDNGTDLIHVALIYRVETVEPVGSPAALANAYFNGVARPPLAQTFRERGSGEVLTVCINHFRAKGSAATGAATDGVTPNPNLDQGDGQGTNNYVRTREAKTLAEWLATDPTGSHDPDFLIIGDLNAYAKEDPLTALESAGFVNLTEKFEGEDGYSYAFNGQYGHLDHALATATLAGQVKGAATWHVNADEPPYLDYNVENKSPAQQALNTDTPYRYSDHDPVVIGIDLAPPVAPGSFAAWLSQWSLPPEQRGPDADPDGDGAENLLEYKLGGRPDFSDTTPLMRAQIEGGQFVFRYSVSRSATEGQLDLWQSNDLEHWQPVTQAPVLESSSDGLDRFKVTLPLPEKRLFVKLTVTR